MKNALIWDAGHKMSRKVAKQVEDCIAVYCEEAMEQGRGADLVFQGTPKYKQDRGCLVVCCETKRAYKCIKRVAVPRAAEHLEVALKCGMVMPVATVTARKCASVLLEKKSRGNEYETIFIRTLCRKIACSNKGIVTEAWKVTGKREVKGRKDKVLVFVEMDEESYVRVIDDRKGVVKIGFKAAVEFRAIGANKRGLELV